MRKLIVRIKGGLGNQLFSYAAARRLSIANNAELVIDDVTGFARDTLYHRQCALDHFSITCRKATPSEMLQPFERLRRGAAKVLSRVRPFSLRSYLEEESPDFDPRILDIKVNKTLYLEGYWQCLQYFEGVEKTIREDLCIKPPQDLVNISMAERILRSNAVSIHVRWFDDAAKQERGLNLPQTYYSTAIKKVLEKVENPHFFIFSDRPVDACRILGLSADIVTVVAHNQGDSNAYADLWLMTLCKHFVIANSTFSWWGAWLARNSNKLIFAPNSGFSSKDSVPSEWILV